MGNEVLSGNNSRYDLENVAVLEETVKTNSLSGKTICFLGSSVTKGEASEGISFADYIGKRNQCTIIKDAVSGTTLVDEGPDSYVDRIKKIDKCMKIDLFVCQLSTNDASQKKTLGEISDGKETNSKETNGNEANNKETNCKATGNFDVTTITGAMEYIITYARATWKCPVVFFTNIMYDSLEYQNMVTRLFELQKKWNIGVIDLWGDAEMNEINSETHFGNSLEKNSNNVLETHFGNSLEKNSDNISKMYSNYLYMADPIHPTKAGYLEWWTPKMEKYLKNFTKQ